MEDNGLVQRALYNESPPRLEYVLTDKGKSLGSVEPIGYIPPAEAEANYWRQQAHASTTTKPAQSAALQEG